MHAGNKAGKAQSQIARTTQPCRAGRGLLLPRRCTAAIPTALLPTLAGGGIRFGLVRSDDQPPSPQRDGEQAGRRAGGGEAWPGPWALQMGRVHTRPSIARSMRYKSSRAVRTLDGVLLPYRPGLVSHWDRRRRACRKGEARLRWTSGRLLAERERKRLGTEAGYFVRRPLREKASPNITRGPERSHKGCAPPPSSTFRQLSQTRDPSRAGPSQPSRDPCQVAVSSESGQERIQCFPRTQRGEERDKEVISHYVQCCTVSSDLNRLSGSFQCSKRSRT